MMGHNGKMEDGCLQKYFTCCHVSETKLKEKIAAVIHIIEHSIFIKKGFGIFLYEYKIYVVLHTNKEISITCQHVLLFNI
jgi:hypothetical protein